MDLLSLRSSRAEYDTSVVDFLLFSTVFFCNASTQNHLSCDIKQSRCTTTTRAEIMVDFSSESVLG